MASRAVWVLFLLGVLVWEAHTLPFRAGRDHYTVLNVSSSASLEEIRAAYRKLALRWHPDKNQDNLEEANKRFAEVAAAYETLSNSHSRKQYDATRFFRKFGWEDEDVEVEFDFDALWSSLKSFLEDSGDPEQPPWGFTLGVTLFLIGYLVYSIYLYLRFLWWLLLLPIRLILWLTSKAWRAFGSAVRWLFRVEHREKND